MRREKKVVNCVNANQQNAQERAMRFKVTYMFTSLIFAFTIPYMLFVCYNAAAILFKLNTSLTIDYASRLAGVSLMYANGAVGSTILFHRFQYLRHSLHVLLRRVFRRNEIHAAGSATNQIPPETRDCNVDQDTQSSVL